jgi:hypothetical protein
MNSFSSPLPCTTEFDQILSVPRCDRWQIYHRLQELDIPCHCLPDGRLQVELRSAIAFSQVWSVLQQFTASRKQLVNWLEQCW